MTRLERLTVRSLLGMMLLGVAVIGQHRMLESDVFWHLHQGRGVLRALSRVIPEPTAFPELAAHTKVAAWLWDVTAFLTFDVAGYAGLSALVSLCAVLAAVAALWMLRVLAPRAPAAAYLLVAALAVTCITSRARARPEVAAMIMLPLLVGALGRFVRAVEPAWKHGALALGAAFAWAQLHGSFLLVLPIGAAVLGPALLGTTLLDHTEPPRQRDPQRRRALLLLGGGLLLASLSSTQGLGLLAYGSEHASTDIQLHNAEMHPPVWGTFNPLTNTFGPLYVVALGLGIYGALGGARVLLAELGLALIGVAVATQSVRFLATATVLTAPLALHGASRLLDPARSPRWRIATLVLAGALSLLVFQRAFERAQQTIGPLGLTGIAEHTQPLSAARYLARAPAGTRALTAYDAGGILGFLLDGHARTFVDSRTMVLFDDVQFALARDVFRSRAVLERASRRYHADVIVLPRDGAVCAELGPPWRPVAIDPAWSTFSKLDDGQGLHAIAPCGRDFLLPSACEGERAGVRADLVQLRALRPSPLLDFIEAQSLQRCAHDVTAATRVLPRRESAEGFVVARDLLAAELDLQQSGGRHAVELVGAYAAQGDLAAWGVLLRAAGKGSLKAADVLPVARAAVAKFDDRAPPAIRELLAMLCTEVGDAHCAYFHGLRAALEGSPNADAVLAWLSTQHPDPKVRAEAKAFRATLATEHAP